MSKIFVVIKHDVDYTDIPVRLFLTKKEAQVWVENNFVPTLNKDPFFCDFKIKEEEVVEDTAPAISAKTFIKSNTWIDAYLSKDFKEVRIVRFMEEDEDDDFQEVAFFVKSMNEYNTFCKLPKDLTTRMDIVGYVKWFTKSHAKKEV